MEMMSAMEKIIKENFEKMSGYSMCRKQNREIEMKTKISIVRKQRWWYFQVEFVLTVYIEQLKRNYLMFLGVYKNLIIYNEKNLGRMLKQS